MPVSGLLYAAGFWGLVWYPLRYLDSLGLAGVWQTLVSYTAAVAVLVPFLRAGDPWRRHLGDVLVLGLASGWCNLAFILAMLDGNVVRVLLLFYLSPVWTVLLGRWLLGERITARALGLLATAMAGAVLMLWDPALRHPWPADVADWLALSSGFAFALSNVMVRRLRDLSLVGKTVTAWAGAVLIALLAVVILQEHLPEVPPRAWGGALLLGLVGFFSATFALQYGVSHLPVQRSSVILLFELVVGTVSAAVFAGERLGSREWVGGFVIVVAGYAVARRRGEGA